MAAVGGALPEDVPPVESPAAEDEHVHVADAPGGESEPLVKESKASAGGSSGHEELNAQADRDARTRLLVSGAVALVWYILGVTFFTLYEELSLVDGWYFTTVTVTTVGYGVIVPSDEVSRMVTAFYTVASCVLIAFGLANAIQSMRKAFDTAIAQQGFAQVSVVKVVGFRAVMTTIMMTISITIGTLIGVVAMELSFCNALYWSVITLTTVGYGDFTPKTASERVWGGLFVLFGTSTFALGISQIMAIFMINAKKKDVVEFMTPPITEEKIAAMDFDGDGVVTKEGYLKFMLVKGGFVDPHVIDDLLASFQELDADGSGVLDKDDCINLIPTKTDAVFKKIDDAFNED